MNKLINIHFLNSVPTFINSLKVRANYSQGSPKELLVIHDPRSKIHFHSFSLVTHMNNVFISPLIFFDCHQIFIWNDGAYYLFISSSMLVIFQLVLGNFFNDS